MAGFDAARRRFVRGEGAYLIDARGMRVFDAVSSIWTTLHGHCRPEIVAAIAAQAGMLDHATLLGATNPPAEALAAQLTRLSGTDRAFFSGDGASAIEAALKMSLQYWRACGKAERTRFVRLGGSYHGDTAAAMSVSDISVFKENFGAVTFETLPYEAASQVLTSHDVAAVIVEPLVQAAAGMQIIPVERYDAFRTMAPLLIVDEIATGFGRTGTMFAFEQVGLSPDIVCVGKGLTGGTLALSATLVCERVFAAFLGQGNQFFHGHSFAGNPIACAAALASLDLFESDGTLERIASLGVAIAPRLARLRAHERVREVRAVGLMAGIELVPDPRVPGGAGRTAADALYDRGYFTRPIGDVLQLVPPYCSTAQELEGFFDAVEAVLA